MVVIEHNLDVIKTADWVIDLGPEGGDGGGRIIASGTPEAVAKIKGSYTGRYLAPLLEKVGSGGMKCPEAGTARLGTQQAGQFFPHRRFVSCGQATQRTAYQAMIECK